MVGQIMNRFHVPCLVCCVAVLSAACAGRSRIAGRIVDEQGAAIHQVSIETEPPTDFAISGRHGHFMIIRRVDEGDPTAFTPLPPGEYKLMLDKTGYISKEVPLLVEKGQITNVGDVLLKQKTIEVVIEDPTRNPGKEGKPVLLPPIRDE